MSVNREEVIKFRQEVEDEWRNNIAPFWLKYAPDEKHGGFHGLVSGDLSIDERAEKGIILNARILWTFSRAYKLYQEDAFQWMAERAYSYLTEHFVDREHGGVFWTVDYLGMPLDRKKRVYAQAFALYALVEFYSASHEREALAEAFEIFNLLEIHCRDQRDDGYFETFEEDWSLASDQRLSAVDMDEKKSMNTHLHMMEAYATLLRALDDREIKERLRAIINIFLNRIIHPQGLYLQMFFDETWACKSTRRSFGHDIEASWLLCEAAEVLGEREMLEIVSAVALKIAESVYENGLDADGSLLYEAEAGRIADDEKTWWTQAEAVIGFVNAYELSGAEHFLAAARRTWEFIKRSIIDRENGEWFWKTARDGTPASDMPKLGQWKCPYHNGRMCFEIKKRLSIAEFGLRNTE
ncbi:MAG TPA: AGE family epimerase/isomerase [Pyrinomonadaceae bacterium]